VDFFLSLIPFFPPLDQKEKRKKKKGGECYYGVEFTRTTVSELKVCRLRCTLQANFRRSFTISHFEKISNKTYSRISKSLKGKKGKLGNKAS